MVHRKLAADNIFNGDKMLGPDAVLIINNQAEIIDLINEADAGENVERYKGILSPGFINCHCHLELSHMKGLIPRHSGMLAFLMSVMNNRKEKDEHIFSAIIEADNEMNRNGIVAVADICNTDHTMHQKRNSTVYYHNFIEATGFIDASAPARFNAAVELYNRFADIGVSSIVPHAPYSVSNTLFSLINNFRKDSLLTMHNQESLAENEFFLHAKGDLLKLYASINVDIKHFQATGESSLMSILSKFTAQHSLILVHNVFTNENDLQSAISRINNLYWCLCPNANQYIGNDLPDIQLLRKYSAKIVLGTDSLASNDELNILSEIKTIKKNFPEIELVELLQWATINGAEAMGIQNQYGSFTKGKRPGINLINDFRITPLPAREAF